MRILLVEDHKLFRQALGRYLRMIKDVQSVHEASNGAEAFNLVKAIDKIDIMILDVRMPVMDGYETFERCSKNYPEIKIIMLTQYDDKSIILHFLRQGARGFLLKNIELDELNTALDAIMSGYNYMPAHVLEIVKDSIQDIAKPSLLNLNPRSKKMLLLLARGFTSKEMAEHMRLSVKTINTYRERMLKHTHTKNVAELISFAFKNGILQ